MTTTEIINSALELPIKKRLAVTQALLRSLSADKLLALGCERRCKTLMSIMASMLNVEEIPNSRDDKWVWARLIVANRLRTEGYSYAKIGEAMGMDHSTIIHYCKRLKVAQSVPAFYVGELELLRLFNEAVSLQEETPEK